MFLKIRSGLETRSEELSIFQSLLSLSLSSRNTDLDSSIYHFSTLPVNDSLPFPIRITIFSSVINEETHNFINSFIIQLLFFKMNNLEIEPRNVHLKGLSRSASFQIHNHH